MKTYQIFIGDRMKNDNLTINDLYKHIPAGAKIISGNKTRMITEPEGGFYWHTEIQATYKLMDGTTLTVIEKQ